MITFIYVTDISEIYVLLGTDHFVLFTGKNDILFIKAASINLRKRYVLEKPTMKKENSSLGVFEAVHQK